MRLYFFQQSRATRVRWMLEELGIPYELAPVDMMKGEHKQPAYLKVHPLGALPAIEDDGGSLFESAAIIMQLADKYPEKNLAPAVGSYERVKSRKLCSSSGGGSGEGGTSEGLDSSGVRG